MLSWWDGVFVPLLCFAGGLALEWGLRTLRAILEQSFERERVAVAQRMQDAYSEWRLRRSPQPTGEGLVITQRRVTQHARGGGFISQTDEPEADGDAEPRPVPPPPPRAEQPAASSPPPTDPNSTSPAPRAVAADDEDQFATVLIEYYSYGLTQAKRSFNTSQFISAIGVAVILFGVVLAIWRAETTGGMFASIVTSGAGVISTVIGQLVHRRADIALKHMADQTESLRADMRAERSGDQAIALLDQVTDPEVKTRLQAGLIMKLSGAKMPDTGAPSPNSVVRAPHGEVAER
ncbi:hypothetical protein ACIHCX_10780 [Streptomyces sp. NPDC052043]|uniref:TRADD-N-associated membrane domain-containing protein n=1 Tax=Streptomyces sp. NPDC052043 TaxID=3365684 RepID=UPI0037CFA7BB